MSSRATDGFIDLGFTRIPCVIGRSGRTVLKREGDGATPAGRFGIVYFLYRANRFKRPSTSLPLRRLKPNDGWCDAPGDRNYNRHVTHPYPARAEKLWRQDHLYDVIGVINYNISPRIKGRGSAIFLHLSRSKGTPTEGCIGVDQTDMARLMSMIGPNTQFIV